MRFPNNTIPFTPDSNWYGSHKGNTGCYDQQNTNLVLIKYENVRAEEEIKKINYETLNKKLANWYLNILPPQKRQNQILKETQLGTDFFQQIINDNNIPTERKIWQRNEREQTTAAEAYAGATYDTKYVYESPFNDVIQWDIELAMTGCLPDTYPKFLQ